MSGGLALPIAFRSHFEFLCFPGACRRKDSRSLWAKGLLLNLQTHSLQQAKCSSHTLSGAEVPNAKLTGRLARTTAHSLPHMPVSYIS